MSERDTHFSGFAKLLWSDILAKIAAIEVDNDDLVDGCSMCSTSDEDMARVIEPLIAQRAYDLVHHSLDTPGICFSTGSYEMKFGIRQLEYLYDTDEIMKRIPDMTEWPKIA